MPGKLDRKSAARCSDVEMVMGSCFLFVPQRMLAGFIHATAAKASMGRSMLTTLNLNPAVTRLPAAPEAV